jgi:hypothetical protein
MECAGGRGGRSGGKESLQGSLTASNVVVQVVLVVPRCF